MAHSTPIFVDAELAYFAPNFGRVPRQDSLSFEGFQVPRLSVN